MTLLSNLGVSLQDYQNGNYDGQALFDTSNITPEQLSELSKALDAGSITGRETANLTNASGAPLKVESLENTLKVITFKESDIVFWKRVPKLAAYNTVEEFNQLASYGTEAGVFTNEGELPREEDSIYIRRAEIVKFLGVTKIVSHPMQLVKTHIGSIIQQEIKNGTLFMLRKADRALAYADANIIPQEFNGYYAQQRNAFPTFAEYMASDSVIDLRGKALAETNIENGALSIISNFGLANLLMAPPVVLTDFVKKFYEAKFIQPNTAAVTAGVMGQRVQKFQSQYGEIDLGYDIFFNANPPRKTGDDATHPQAPAKPTAVGIAASATDPDSLFNTLTAGDYFYAVAAKNRYGESALTSMNGGSLLHVADGKRTDLQFTSGGGANPATGYVIYRSVKDAASSLAATPLYPIFEVSTAQLSSGYDGGANGKIGDRNRFIAGCQQAMLLQADEEVFSFKQLAPLMKMDLAVLSPATRFMILMYGTPMLYAPKKMVRYVNIGRDTTGI
jgi:hypothetical protein